MHPDLQDKLNVLLWQGYVMVKHTATTLVVKKKGALNNQSHCKTFAIESGRVVDK